MSGESSDENTIIFIGGFLRSGTSLLQSILCRGEDTNPMIGEAIHLRGLVESYWRGLSMFDQHSRFYFDDREELRRFCAVQVRQFLDVTRERLGNPRHLILKHPQLTPHFPLLFELVPESRFLAIVRDPRDTVASAVKSRQNGAQEFGNATPLEIAKTILTYFNSCVSCRNAEFKKNIRYHCCPSVWSLFLCNILILKSFS